MVLPLNPFAAACVRFVADALGQPAALFSPTAPPRPEMGDFAVGVFPAARALKAPPPALAARAAAAFVATDVLAEATAAGPFINFRVRRPALFRHIIDGTLIPDIGHGETVCIDFSSPNISKHLAYHHIRSTVIGHALANIYRALGYRVVGINHLGDWGTTHGMLLAAYARWGAPEPLTITALNDLYVRFRAEMAENPALETEGREWFFRLENGDAEARRVWSQFRAVSLAEFETIYEALGIHFDEIKGESEYEADIPEVIAMLEERGLLSQSQGATVVDLSDADMPPMLIRKQDGATLYGTRDLAAAIYRHRAYRFSRSLYVVDRGQALHFRQLVEVLSRAGFPWAEKLAHVPFGLVRIGGKKTGTRTGNVVLLKEVLAEAEDKSRARIAEANPEMDPALLASAARAVGLGAVVFANLSTQREKDVDFSWTDVLSWEGDSGPYIQYAHARTASVLRRAGETLDTEACDTALLDGDPEWALALKLADLGDVTRRAAEQDEPHTVSRYLLDVCALFSRWYTAGNQDPARRILCADAATRQARLALCAATQRALRQGLALLGIAAPDAM